MKALNESLSAAAPGANPMGQLREGGASLAQRHAAMKYRPDIDGLRAVAVLAVLGFHAFGEWLPGGFIGVDIFFVISGYLISSIIFEQVAQGRFSIGDFYARRVRRIFPALIVILAFCIVGGWLLLFPHEYKQLGKHIAAGAGFSSNFVLWREAGYFDASADSKLLLHLWSLGIEEQFYFFWPAVIYLAWKRKLNLVAVMLALVAISFALNIALLGSKAVAVFYLPFTRMWELLIGGVLAHIVRGREHHAASPANHAAQLQSFAGAGLIMASLFLLDRYVAFPGWWALLPVAGACLVISAGPRAWVNAQILSHPFFVWFGLISFPLYLWHWPLLAFAHIVESARPPLEVRVLAVGASIALAWLTFQWVEKRLRSREGAQWPLFWACGAILLFGLAAWQGWLDPRHNSPQVKLVADAIADWKYPPESFSRLEYDGQRFYQRPGASGGQAVFIGDSDLQQYAVRVEHLLDAQPAQTKSSTFAATGGCPPIPGVLLDRSPSCQPALQAASKLALENKIDTVVVGACWYCYFHQDAQAKTASEYYVLKEGRRHALDTPEGQTLALESLAAWLQKMVAQKKVYFVLSSPVSESVDPRTLLTGTRFGTLEYKQVAGIQESEFQAKFGAMNERLRSLAMAAGATVIDPLPSMCKQGVCSALTAEGVPIYSDGVHIRASFVRQHATFIDPSVKVVTAGAQ